MKLSKAPSLTRRRFLTATAAGVGMAAGLGNMRVWGNGLRSYGGKLLVTLQLDGGADVTQLCDPKTNTKGERKINKWADTSDPGQHGNLLYAPVADNARLFERFGADMMVVNGVDAQTNSHETGKLYNWTGSNAEGKPSLTALHAATYASEQPLAYAVYNGTSRTAGIITYNRFDDISRLRELTQPTVMPWSGDPMRPDGELEQAQALASNAISQLLNRRDLTPRQRASLIQHQTARESRESLQGLAEMLPSNEEFIEPEQFQVGDFNFWSNLHQQMQGALLVFKSGLGASADLALGGFDSHENHDDIHSALYTHVSDAIHFFWDYAEELGLADRIVMMVGTDFGRTNHYNDGNGKDHWPIASYMIIEKNAPWGDRIVGQSDELHFARSISPSTLKVSNSGVIMTPAHVHKAVRRYLGVESTADTLGFGLRNIEDLPLFDPSKRTT